MHECLKRLPRMGDSASHLAAHCPSFLAVQRVLLPMMLCVAQKQQLVGHVATTSCFEIALAFTITLPDQQEIITKCKQKVRQCRSSCTYRQPS
jgi:hypothetical protein